MNFGFILVFRGGDDMRKQNKPKRSRKREEFCLLNKRWVLKLI